MLIRRECWGRQDRAELVCIKKEEEFTLGVLERRTGRERSMHGWMQRGKREIKGPPVAKCLRKFISNSTSKLSVVSVRYTPCFTSLRWNPSNIYTADSHGFLGGLKKGLVLPLGFQRSRGWGRWASHYIPEFLYQNQNGSYSWQINVAYSSF